MQLKEISIFLVLEANSFSGEEPFEQLGRMPFVI